VEQKVKSDQQTDYVDDGDAFDSLCFRCKKRKGTDEEEDKALMVCDDCDFRVAHY